MSVACTQLRGVVRARAGGPPGPGHVCVCVCAAAQMVIISYRAGRPVSACSVVQMLVQLCVALLTASDVALYAAAAVLCVDLDDLGDNGGRCNAR